MVFFVSQGGGLKREVWVLVFGEELVSKQVCGALYNVLLGILLYPGEPLVFCVMSPVLWQQQLFLGHSVSA